jgi:hypothetical protein
MIESPSSGEVRHETSDANLRGVFAFGAGLFFILLGTIVGLVGLFHYFAAREDRLKGEIPPLAVGDQGRLPPEPRLEGIEKMAKSASSPAGKPAPSEGYSWVDREAGIVRIPVQNAMKILAQQLQAEGPQSSRPKEDQALEEPTASNSGRTSKKGQR